MPSSADTNAHDHGRAFISRAFISRAFIKGVLVTHLSWLAVMRHALPVILALTPCTVLADELRLPSDQIQAGRVQFLEKCAQCHGKDASGGNAPNIQGILPEDVKDAARGVESMPEIALSEAEARQIAIFLMSLAPDEARARLRIK